MKLLMNINVLENTNLTIRKLQSSLVLRCRKCFGEGHGSAADAMAAVAKHRPHGGCGTKSRLAAKRKTP
jgi:hypothetical protein